MSVSRETYDEIDIGSGPMIPAIVSRETWRGSLYRSVGSGTVRTAVPSVTEWSCCD